ncbi:hypothetical protein LCGC14_2737700 [marine sediment metagenome]|uniref:Uncharacterized protein n=1 Tax=marine sediment metagenome TaxID=412755 RepID=A0A0F8Z5F4_9ZZZZ|nr:hypothetical protein [bacterium]
MPRKNNATVAPDKIYPKNKIGDIDYFVTIKFKDGRTMLTLSLTEFKYLHDAYYEFEYQTGFKGFE